MQYNISICIVYELNRILVIFCIDDDEDKEYEFGKLVVEYLIEIYLGIIFDKFNKVINVFIYIVLFFLNKEIFYLFFLKRQKGGYCIFD